MSGQGKGSASNERIIESFGQYLLRDWRVLHTIVARLRELGLNARFECVIGGHNMDETEYSKFPTAYHDNIDILIKVQIDKSIEDFHSTFHLSRTYKWGGGEGKFHSKTNKSISEAVERAIFERMPQSGDIVFLSDKPDKMGLNKFTEGPIQKNPHAEVMARNIHHLIFQCVEAALREGENQRAFSDNIEFACRAISMVGKIPHAHGAAAAGAGGYVDTYFNMMDKNGNESTIIKASANKRAAYERALQDDKAALMRKLAADNNARGRGEAAAEAAAAAAKPMSKILTGATFENMDLMKVRETDRAGAWLSKFTSDLDGNKISLDDLRNIVENDEIKKSNHWKHTGAAKALLGGLRVKKFEERGTLSEEDKLKIKTEIDFLEKLIRTLQQGGKRKTRRTKKTATHTRKSRQ